MVRMLSRFRNKWKQPLTFAAIIESGNRNCTAKTLILQINATADLQGNWCTKAAV